MNDKDTAQFLNVTKVVNRYPINTVVGWYNMVNEQKFGVVKSYTFNSAGETCIEVELIVGASDPKVVVSLHPDNKQLEVFKV